MLLLVICFASEMSNDEDRLAFSKISSSALLHGIETSFLAQLTAFSCAKNGDIQKLHRADRQI